MAENNFDEKTEKPTPRRREEVRKKGEVAKSRELPSVAVLVSGLIATAVFGAYMLNNVQMITEECFSIFAGADLNVNQFMAFARRVVRLFILAISPLLGAITITAVLANLLQVGFLLSGELIRPKLSKLDPLKGLQRLFSGQSFMELFKSLLKLAIVGVVAYVSVKGEMEALPFLGQMQLNAAMIYILHTTLKIALKCSLAMVLLVAIDYAYQRWEFEKRIRMSRKEVKDEFKRTEGDPLIKSRIRNIQMQMARRRMMQAVPHADVVITNPTHLAVALKYDSLVMAAPRVVAKGAGALAERIKEIARAHEIPVVENRELARGLYASVQIDQEIPTSFYQAVAEVLAYVYGLRRQYANAG